jgi:cytidylate kinase
LIVALDGPAGAGKSTVSRALARALGAVYLDSGAMYRIVALQLMAGQDPVEAARATKIDLGERITADGVDVTEAIRFPEVSNTASEVAEIPEVREALVEQQRRLLHDGRTWVAEGRDIGTVVAPEAELKIYLTASPEERARRRAAELGAGVEEVLADQAARDRRDSEREASPLKKADDAVEFDTSGLSIDEVVSRLAALATEMGA